MRRLHIRYPRLLGTACLTFFVLDGFCSISMAFVPELRLAVFGDVHYKIPKYSIADYFVELVSKELADQNPHPSFLLKTGDFFQANCNTDLELEAFYAFKHFTSTIGMPFYIAIGNHDKRNTYEKNALPIFSRQLGQTLATSYYSFDKNNCHFLILDCMQRDFTGQLAWAENDLKAALANPKIKHIFAAGYYPLWIVVRSGFTNQAYAKPFAKLLTRYRYVQTNRDLEINGSRSDMDV